MPRRLLHTFVFAFSLAGGAACETPTEASYDRPRDPPVSTAVTGAAAAALGSDGYFRIVDDSMFGADSLISTSRAQTLASAALEREHLAFNVWSRGEAYVSLAYPQVMTCGPARLLPSPTLPFTDAVSLFTRWSYGRWYNVSVCDSAGVARGIVTVSAMLTRAGLSDSAYAAALGQIHPIFSSGLPVWIDLVFTPEQVAIAALRLTGRRVTAVPRPVADARSPYYPLRWSVTLEAAIALVDSATGTRDTASSVILGLGHSKAALYRLSATYNVPPTIQVPSISFDADAPVTYVTATLTDTARRRLDRVYLAP